MCTIHTLLLGDGGCRLKVYEHVQEETRSKITKFERLYFMSNPKDYFCQTCYIFSGPLIWKGEREVLLRREDLIVKSYEFKKTRKGLRPLAENL